jgi:hypothetical protein
VARLFAPEAGRLTRGLALVEHLSNNAADGEPLRLRPEVRAATIQLLDAEDHERVREIDRRAATWYAAQAPSRSGLAAAVPARRTPAIPTPDSTRLAPAPTTRTETSRASGVWNNGYEEFARRVRSTMWSLRTF